MTRTWQTEPHAAQELVEIEDVSIPDDRIYGLSDTGSGDEGVILLGSELMSLARITADAHGQVAVFLTRDAAQALVTFIEHSSPDLPPDIAIALKEALA